MSSKLHFFVEQEYTQNYNVKNHTHPCYELIYYVDGNGQTTINDKKYAFDKGSFALVKSNSIHSESSSMGATVMFIGFSTKYDDLTEGVYFDQFGNIRATMEEIAKEKDNKLVCYRQMLDILTEKLVINILRLNKQDAKEMQMFDEILSYIKMNANKNISIKQIAYALGYSYDYFRQMFIAKMGISAKKYLLETKLENVKEYLINSDYKVEKIAELTGFASASALCAVFKAETGMNPNKFRTEQKQTNIGINNHTDTDN